MLEFYQAFAKGADLMRLTEEMLFVSPLEIAGTQRTPWETETIDLDIPVPPPHDARGRAFVEFSREDTRGPVPAGDLGFPAAPAGRGDALRRRAARPFPRQARQAPRGGLRGGRRAPPPRAHVHRVADPLENLAALASDPGSRRVGRPLRALRRRHGNRERLLRAQRPGRPGEPVPAPDGGPREARRPGSGHDEDYVEALE